MTNTFTGIIFRLNWFITILKCSSNSKSVWKTGLGCIFHFWMWNLAVYRVLDGITFGSDLKSSCVHGLYSAGICNSRPLRPSSLKHEMKTQAWSSYGRQLLISFIHLSIIFLPKSAILGFLAMSKIINRNSRLCGIEMFFYIDERHLLVNFNCFFGFIWHLFGCK